jgi:hypothetical protein
MDRPLLCVLKKKGNSFFLFQSFQNSKYLLLGARKRYLPSCSSFDLSTDIRSSQAKGKRSCFCWCFFCDDQVQLREVGVRRTQQRSLEISCSFSIAVHQVSRRIVASVSQSKLSCGLQCPVSSSSHNMRWLYPAARRGRIAPATASRATAAAKRSFVTWNCFWKTRRVYSSSILSHNGEETEEEEEELGKWRWRFA